MGHIKAFRIARMKTPLWTSGFAEEPSLENLDEPLIKGGNRPGVQAIFVDPT